MDAHEFIIGRQIDWATRHGIQLIGSQGDRGRKAYTETLEQNLFEPLSPVARESFENGDGKELARTPEAPAKMQAVHSSSALGVNVFHYWERIGHVSEMVVYCGFSGKGGIESKTIHFEEKYPVTGINRKPPNIDVVIHNQEKETFQRLAVECKFSEPYSSEGHGGLKSAYLQSKELWGDIPQLRTFAETISPEDSHFQYLHAAQLAKHILGLKSRYAKGEFGLLYLWYDVPFGEGVRHRKEIEEFAAIAQTDGVYLHAMTYQELIGVLESECSNEHARYIHYLKERYL